jgi:integrase/recombinase XerC
LNLKQVNEFLRDLKSLENKSSRTCTIYRDVLNSLLNFLKGRAINQELLRQFIHKRSKSLAASSLSLHISALRRYFHWAEKQGYIQEPLEKHLIRPKVPIKHFKVFDEEDLPKLLKVIENASLEEQLLFELLYGDGLRISEATNLKWIDVDLKNKKLHVLGKGNKTRKLPLRSRIIMLLKKKKHSKKSLWEHPSQNLFRKWVKNWGEESGLNKKFGSFHPHKLRHSIATHLVRRGAKLTEIKRFLGHRQLQTTVRYTHLNIQDLCKAVDDALPEIMQNPIEQNRK